MDREHKISKIDHIRYKLEGKEIQVYTVAVHSDVSFIKNNETVFSDHKDVLSPRVPRFRLVPKSFVSQCTYVVQKFLYIQSLRLF